MVPTLPEELLVCIFDHLALRKPVEFDDFVEQTRNRIIDEESKTSQQDDAHAGESTDAARESRYREALRPVEAKLQSFDMRREYGRYVRDGVSTLRSVCLASKKFHRLAWSVLYRTFNDEVFEASSFLRTVALKPENGMALRTLRSTSWKALDGLEAHEFFELLQSDATLTALFQWRARGFWLGEDKDYEEKLGTGDLKSYLLRSLNLGSQDGHMVLLLLLCPNIRELDFLPPLDINISVFARFLKTVLSKDFQSRNPPETDNDFEQEESDYVLAQMFGASWPAQPLRKPQVLQQLRSLTVRYPGLSGMGPAIFLDLMSLPSLAELRFDSLRGSFGGTRHNFERASTCPHLKELELETCQLQTSELAAIVRRCPELTTLSVRWANTEEVDASLTVDPPWCLKYGEVGKAIAEHAPSLSELTLDHLGGWTNVGAEPKRPYALGDTLAELKDLSLLFLDERAIWGSEWGSFGSGLASAVPKSVVNLYISSRQEADDSASRHPRSDFHLMQDADIDALLKDESFPRLAKITILGRIISFDYEAALEHGWKSIRRDDDNGLGISFRSHCFENQARGH